MKPSEMAFSSNYRCQNREEHPNSNSQLKREIPQKEYNYLINLPIYFYYPCKFTKYFTIIFVRGCLSGGGVSTASFYTLLTNYNNLTPSFIQFLPNGHLIVQFLE